MFDAAAPTTLYRLGEVMDRTRFTWTSLPGTPMNTDLAHTSVSDHAWLGPAYSVDFQPWWMCLVPRAAVEAIGLPMPFFLKWDDVEFGLRAKAAGFASVVLPGAVVWHDSWVGKDAESGWQAYFLLRNRIVTALLHDTRPTVLVAEWMAVSLRHLAQREPAAAAMRWAALKDVLHGPGWLHRDLGTARERAAETARREIVAPHPVSAMAGSVSASARLLRRWSDLRAQYRAALPEATSTRRWEQTFTAAAVLERRRPTWSIVVTSFHSLDMLTRHWDGLIQAGELQGVAAQDVEVIVVDNADEPEVEEFAREQGFRLPPDGQQRGSVSGQQPWRGARHRRLPAVRQPRSWRQGRGPVDPGGRDRPHGRHRGAAGGLPRWHAPERRTRGAVPVGQARPSGAGPQGCSGPLPVAGGPVRVRAGRVVRRGERRRCPERCSTESAAGPRSTSSTWRTSSSASAPVGWAYRFP